MRSAVHMNHGESAQIVALLCSQWARKRYSESRLWLIFCSRSQPSVPVFHHLPLKSNAHYFSIDSRGEIHEEYQHSRGLTWALPGMFLVKKTKSRCNVISDPVLRSVTDRTHAVPANAVDGTEVKGGGSDLAQRGGGGRIEAPAGLFSTTSSMFGLRGNIRRPVR